MRKLHYVLIKDGEILGLRKFKPEVTEERIAARFVELKQKGFDTLRVGNPPSIKTLEKYSYDGVCKSIRGQRVEPDHPESWLRVLGYI